MDDKEVATITGTDTMNYFFSKKKYYCFISGPTIFWMSSNLNIPMFTNHDDSTETFG
jgi:hypothetical protein